jgi:hypothetical protein
LFPLRCAWNKSVMTKPTPCLIGFTILFVSYKSTLSQQKRIYTILQQHFTSHFTMISVSFHHQCWTNPW